MDVSLLSLLLVFAALLLTGAGLIVFSRRGDAVAPRTAVLGSGLALILASRAGLAAIMAVEHLSARAARHAEVEALRAKEAAQAKITALIEEGNRLAAEAAAERDRAPAPPAETEPGPTPDEPDATEDD